MEIDITEKKIAASIYVISCGEAINGEQIIRSALVQYPKIQMPVIKVPHVRKIEQVIDVFKNVKIISVEKHTVHKSKRIICNEFII